MNIPNYDSRTADKFVARLPDGLRAEIEAAADATDRSMNSVFVQAVRQYLDGQKRQQLLLEALANAVAQIQNPTGPGDDLHIDERVRLVADAKRYRHLRDRACIQGPATDLLVQRGSICFSGIDLDREVDHALRLASLEELHPCAA